MRPLFLFLYCGLVLVLPAQADEQRVREQLKQLQPDILIEHIVLIEGAGVYQVQLSVGQFLYVDQTGRYVLHGELYQISKDRALNLTGQARQKMIAELMQELNPDDMVIFPAKDETRASITVFTDVDCGYCQKLHAEVEELNRQGIQVRYLAWPRQGLSGSTYDTMVSIWCAEDRQQAMTSAKRRQPVAAASCRHPVDRQHALGRQVGVRGTPTIVLENGELIPGYVPAARLVTRALQAR